jgi:hypothetical protein
MSGVGAGGSANHLIALSSDSCEPCRARKQSRGLRAKRVVGSDDVVGYSSFVLGALTLTDMRVVRLHSESYGEIVRHPSLYLRFTGSYD